MRSWGEPVESCQEAQESGNEQGLIQSEQEKLKGDQLSAAGRAFTKGMEENSWQWHMTEQEVMAPECSLGGSQCGSEKSIPWEHCGVLGTSLAGAFSIIVVSHFR